MPEPINKRLPSQKFFFKWFNPIVFPLFYLRHKGPDFTEIEASTDTRFKVRMNSSDALLVWEIWKLKVYDEKRFPILPDHTVVDIGAHIGVFAIRAAQQAHRGRVFAFEPGQVSYELLAHNKTINRADNLTIAHKAVWDHTGELDFFLPPLNAAVGSVMQDHDLRKETVACTSLEAIMDEHRIEQIDYLKLDAEGAEYPILMNSSLETLSRIKFMALEYHNFVDADWDHKLLLARLAEAGFQYRMQLSPYPQKLLFGTGVIKAWR
jgi:FkbM family methyltransferase